MSKVEMSFITSETYCWMLENYMPLSVLGSLANRATMAADNYMECSDYFAPWYNNIGRYAISARERE